MSKARLPTAGAIKELGHTVRHHQQMATVLRAHPEYAHTGPAVGGTADEHAASAEKLLQEWQQLVAEYRAAHGLPAVST